MPPKDRENEGEGGRVDVRRRNNIVQMLDVMLEGVWGNKRGKMGGLE